MARVVVIGGGLGGTASAARLAKLGHEVTVVERLTTLGGALGVVERDGYRWDSGPASTTLPAVIRDLFRKSGRPLERELELVEVQPIREHRFEDGTSVALPSASRAAQREAIDSGLHRGLGQQWLDWTQRFAAVWERLRRDFLEQPYSSEHAPKETTSLLKDRLTLHKAAARAFRDERLRSMALHHAVQGGHDPRNVPWWMGFLDYVEQNFGTWTVPGGFGALAAALEARLQERHVVVLTGTTAHDVLISNGQVSGVDSTAGRLEADVVVSTIDARRLPALKPFVDKTLPAVPPPTCHVGLVGDVPDLPGELVLHGDPTLRVVTTGVAPPGRAAWTIQARGLLSEDILRALARHKIDIRESVEVRIDRSPSQQVEQLHGSPYGVLWQGRRTIGGRLSTRTPISGVYAAGVHTALSPEPPFVGLTAALVAEVVGPATR